MVIQLKALSRTDMELDVPSNYSTIVLGGMESASKLWSDGQKSRLTVGPLKLQSALSQLKPSMFSEDKYEGVQFKNASPIGGSGFL